MKLVFAFCCAFIIVVLLFALYFSCIPHVFQFDRSLAEFSAMFQPLEALFTALAFIAIVIIASAQARELRQMKRDTAQAFVHASRLQAAGARLLSLATQNDPSTAASRRELEQQIEELEQWLQAYLRKESD